MGRPIQARGLATNISLHIDRPEDSAPTPIHQQYLSLIRSANVGDEIVLLQKYFKNRILNQAIVDAAGRGVKVLAIYRDVTRPRCEDLLPQRNPVDCSQLFVRHPYVHHKSMVLHRINGNTTAIIGSFNLRERDQESPRAHTALSFDVESDDVFFSFYKAHAENIRNDRPSTPSFLSLATEGGGKISFTFHPSDRDPVQELLGNLDQCDGPLWLSYYRALPDAVGEPVFGRLEKLVESGCEVRFLLDRDRDNHDAERRLQSLGVAAHYPDEHNGRMTVGHKIVMVCSGKELHLIQSSVNLVHEHYLSQYNLTLYLTGDFPAIEQALDGELSRYW